MAGRENILMGVSYLHPIFFSDFLAGAIRKVQLILRSGGSGVAELEAWSGCCTFFGISEFAPKL